jgi:hypothetical protein
MTYAKDTVVSVEKSRAELDTLLSRHGASQRLMGVDDVAGVAFAGFTLAGRQIRVRVPLPTREQVDRYACEKVQGMRYNSTRRKAWVDKEIEQRKRSRWRALVLLTKAKLEAVELGISTIEREFLADIALPDGTTVHQALEQKLVDAYASGTMPPLLGSGS